MRSRLPGIEAISHSGKLAKRHGLVNRHGLAGSSTLSTDIGLADGHSLADVVDIAGVCAQVVEQVEVVIVWWAFRVAVIKAPRVAMGILNQFRSRMLVMAKR